MIAVLLALGASLSWGVADFGAGVGSRRLPVPLVIVGSQAAGGIYVAILLLIVRPDPPSWLHIGDAYIGGIMGVLGLFAFYRGLAIGAMSIVGPITATGAIVPLAYGLARGERPSTLQLAGVALAVIGVVAAAVEAAEEAERRRIGAGVGLALLAALGFGTSILFLSKASANGDTLWAPLFMRSITVPLTLAVILLATKTPLTGLRVSWLLLAFIGVTDTSANLLFGWASGRGLLSVVSVLASLYPVVLVVLARVFLREKIAPHQLAGVAVALTGVALISAG